MLPKLRKSKRHNEIIQKQQCAYINTKGNITVEACPIVTGPVHLTRGISEMLHIIMKPSLAMISHIAKDYFDFKNTLNTALLEPHLVPVISSHYILTVNMIFLHGS